MHAPLVSLALLFCYLGVAVGCSTGTRIIVATDAVFPPFHYVDENGSLAGFDVEVSRLAVARTLEFEAEHIKAESYADLFAGLLNFEYDLIAATTGITPERMDTYAFTDPYFETCLAVLVRTGPGEPISPTELEGRPIAASKGTTSATAAHQIPGATVYEMNRAAESLEALRTGRVDAMIVDEFEAVPWAAEADDLTVLAEAVRVERYGFVLRKTDLALRGKLNSALERMVTDGTIDRLRTKYGLDRPADWPVRPPDSPRQPSQVRAGSRYTVGKP